MEEKTLITERGTVHYWTQWNQEEQADCLIFLHGLTADHTLFERQVAYFAPKYHILLWDAPAHGKSRPYTNFSYDDAAEVLNGMMQQEQIEQAILVGQSMGGFVIQAFLDRYPEKAKGFVGIDTGPFGLEYYSKSDCWWMKQVGWMSRLYPHQSLINGIAKACSVTEYAYQNMRKALQCYSKSELCRLIGAGYRGFAKANRDIEISCPVLLFLGEQDRLGKLKKYCEAWQKNTGYPIHIVSNASHNSNADCPEMVNADIAEFCEQLNHLSKEEALAKNDCKNGGECRTYAQ